MSDQPDDTVLPCGCYITLRVEDGVNVMQLAPCRRDCHVIEDVTNMTRLAGKQLEVDSEYE